MEKTENVGSAMENFLKLGKAREERGEEIYPIQRQRDKNITDARIVALIQGAPTVPGDPTVFGFYRNGITVNGELVREYPADISYDEKTKIFREVRSQPRGTNHSILIGNILEDFVNPTMPL